MNLLRAWVVVLGVIGVSHGVGAQTGYKLVEWPTPPTSAAGFAAPWNFIQVSSVAVTSKGTVLLLHRGAHPIMEFDTAGKLLRTWGDGLISEGKVAGIPQANWAPTRSRYSAVYGPAGCTSCGAHSVRVDPQGNIWVVDATGHVIYKMNPEGKEIMRLGTKGTAGATQSTFNLPTDIAFAANGHLFISDGYANARILEYTADGKKVREWGTPGTGPGQFTLPHSIQIDAGGVVYVADRENGRVQRFDQTGKFLGEWKYGRTFGLEADGDFVWLATQPVQQPNLSPGWLLKVDGKTGKVAGWVPSTGNHGMDLTSAGELLVGPGPSRVPQRYRLSDRRQ